jgi:hypothetical protein
LPKTPNEIAFFGFPGFIGVERSTKRTVFRAGRNAGDYRRVMATKNTRVAGIKPTCCPVPA